MAFPVTGYSGYPDWLLPQVIGNGIQYEFTRGQYWLGSGLTAESNVLADTRASDAYDFAGTQLFPVNDPVVSAVTGLEGWGAVTNLQLNSDAPSSVAAATLTPNAALAPDGTMTASKLEETATTATHLAFDNAATVNGTTYNRSVFLKAAERTFALVSLSATAHAVGVNLLTGAVISTNGSPANILVEDAGSGWWRISFSAAALSSPNNNQNVYSSLDGVWGNRSYTGEGGKGILVWGNQVTLGTRLEPYVRTTSAAATREPDAITNPNFATHAATFGFASGMAALARVNLTRLSDGAARRIATFGTAADGAYIEFTTSNTFKAVLRKSSADAVTLESGVVGSTGVYDVTATLDPGAYSLTVSGGVTGDTDASAETLPAAIANACYIGHKEDTTLHLNGPLERLALWGV